MTMLTCLLIVCRLYSFLLGRPKMIRKEIFDVALPSLDDPDVNQDPFNLYQAVLIQLSGIVGEALEKVRYDMAVMLLS